MDRAAPTTFGVANARRVSLIMMTRLKSEMGQKRSFDLLLGTGRASSFGHRCLTIRLNVPINPPEWRIGKHVDVRQMLATNGGYQRGAAQQVAR